MEELKQKVNEVYNWTVEETGSRNLPSKIYHKQ
ncbi:Uncharacterised protein [Streptococcus pneumoniae]|nr:Uncharacterised protein [Streptococcus pneumoniae]